MNARINDRSIDRLIDSFSLGQRGEEGETLEVPAAALDPLSQPAKQRTWLQDRMNDRQSMRMERLSTERNALQGGRMVGRSARCLRLPE